MFRTQTEVTREVKKKLFIGDIPKPLETRIIHEKYVIENNCVSSKINKLL